jgi:glycosyltransferase involved in cell wall biosynthesis
MNIGIISTVRGYGWAGSEELWYECAVLAAKSGHRATACLHDDLQSPGHLESLKTLGVKIRRWQTFGFSRLVPLKERLAPSFPERWLRQFDVILVSVGSILDVFYVPGLLEALKKTAVPHVWLCQFNAECFAISASQRRDLREFAQTCAGCCFVSKQNLELTERQLAMKMPMARVMSNPIRKMLPDPLPWPEDEVVRLACVARFEVLWKGQDLMLEILSGPQWMKRSWTLSFFGEGPDLDHLKNSVGFFGLGKRVEFCGYVRELETIWRNHHLMVLASRGEGLPLAILEAMMCGRPVVTTDVGGNREILQDEVTGFIAETATPLSFGQTLERAWVGQSRWKLMGQTAHLRAKEAAGYNPALKLMEFLMERAKHAD